MAMQSCRECPLSSTLCSVIEYRSGFSLERGLQKEGILGTLTYPCAKAFRSTEWELSLIGWLGKLSDRFQFFRTRETLRSLRYRLENHRSNFVVKELFLRGIPTFLPIPTSSGPN